MIDEPLSDGDRRFLLELLMGQVPESEPPTSQVLRLIAQLSGSDTVVVCRRAYPSSASATTPALMIGRPAAEPRPAEPRPAPRLVEFKGERYWLLEGGALAPRHHCDAEGAPTFAGVFGREASFAHVFGAEIWRKGQVIGTTDELVDVAAPPG